MSNFCPHCRQAITKPSAQFCAKCGRPLHGLAVPPPSTVFSLLIRVPGQSPTTSPLAKPVITLGRASDNDLPLNYPTVSGHHARLEQRGGAYQLIDLGSTNGTTMNGRRIPAQQPQPLANGDVIRMGDMQGNSISLTLQAGGGAAAQRGTRLFDPAKFAGMSLISIGRDPASGLPLNSPLVSWRHAQIEQTAASQGAILTDLGSTNGTFVRGQRISRHVLRQGDIIQIGPFQFPYTASGLVPAANVGNVRLDGLHLTRTVKDRKSGKTKSILTDVTLSIQPGEFVAVVGGSGAGKSTLMKALNGQVHADTGQVKINGDDFYTHFDQYRLMLGYVPQDDIVHRDLSVEAALRYAAQLRLPPDTQAVEIERRIDEVLDRLDMRDKRQDVIANLSGGQRKRINIAVEMLADPDLFFLDEPSSGLDPGTEKKLMYDMQRVADSGKTVILITHATDNVGLCDHVAFMGYGGHLVFFGPPQDALTFFQAQSFADIYLKLNGEQEVLRWRRQFESSPQYRQYVQDRLALPGPASAGAARPRAAKLDAAGGARQFFILTHRYLDLIFHSKFSLFVLFAVMPIIGLLLLLISQPFWLTGKSDSECEQKAGITDWDAPDAIERCVDWHLGQSLTEPDTQIATYSIASQAQVLLFMLAFSSSLLGIFGAAFEIVKEQPVYERERMINLGIAPYLLSKFTVLAAFGLLQGALLLLVISLGVKLPTQRLLLPASTEMYITLTLTIWASVSLGLLVSALVPSRDVVVYGMLLVLIVQIVFGGVLFKLPKSVQPVSATTITRWSLDALGTSVRLTELNQYSRLSIQLPQGTDEKSAPIDFELGYGCTRETPQTDADGQEEKVGQMDKACSRGSLIGNWAVLGLFVVGGNSLTGAVLKLKERRAR
jgi:ABC transport system ATP-binding/permease protein